VKIWQYWSSFEWLAVTVGFATKIKLDVYCRNRLTAYDSILCIHALRFVFQTY